MADKMWVFYYVNFCLTLLDYGPNIMNDEKQNSLRVYIDCLQTSSFLIVKPVFKGKSKMVTD